MKKLYTFSLDDDVTLSDKVKNDLKLVAYFLYCSLNVYEKPNGTPILDVGENVLKNELYEYKIVNNDYYYVFLSDEKKLAKMLYNPMIINDRTFGIIINDDFYDNHYQIKTQNGFINILDELDENLKLLNFNYSFRAKAFLLDDKLNIKEVSKLIENKYHVQTKENIKIRKLLPILNILK